MSTLRLIHGQRNTKKDDGGNTVKLETPRTPKFRIKKPANMMEWYPHSAGTFVSHESILCLSLPARGVLYWLRDYCWVHGSAPADPRLLAALLHCDVDAARELIDELQIFFVVKKDRLVCVEIEELRKEQRAKYLKLAEQGARGGAAKRDNRIARELSDSQLPSDLNHLGASPATAEVEPGHSQATAEVEPGHSQATAEVEPGCTDQIRSDQIRTDADQSRSDAELTELYSSAAISDLARDEHSLREIDPARDQSRDRADSGVAVFKLAAELIPPERNRRPDLLTAELIRQFGVEIVRQALERLAQRRHKVRNPGGWLRDECRHQAFRKQR